MSDELDKKIQQIAELLGQDNVPDNLKELVALFASSLGTKKDGEESLRSPEAKPAEKPAATDHAEQSSNLDPDMLDKARKAIERLAPGSDPRINLLQAIKPFMNSNRQKKIGSCIQLLQVAGLSRLMNEQENR